MFEKYIPLLIHNPLFQGIPEQDLADVLASIGAQIKRYTKNELILRADSQPHHLGIVLSGDIQIIKEDVFGNRTIIAQFGAGHMFGEAFAFAQTERLPVSVLSVSDCETLTLDDRLLTSSCPKNCKEHALLVRNMLRILAQKNLLLNEKIEILSRRSTREKLLAYLYGQSLAQKSLSFDIPFNRQQLADYLCVDRSALSSEFGRLRDEGALHFHRQHIELTKNNA